jgi:4-amino-4-deoxy-L-arabinose transferase-like glycosyltransferase
MSNRLQYFLLIIVLSVGIFLRFFRLDSIPAGFFCDEASIGYNAYSILTTGKDEYGVSFPIFFQSFGDYRPPLAIYSAIPFVGIFGLNEMATRLPSMFYGLLTIVTMYFIGSKIGRNRSLGLLTAFIAATMPWLIHYSRTGFEFTIYVSFFTITLFLLLKAMTNRCYLVPAFIASALTFYTYQPAKLMIPLLLFGYLFIQRRSFLIHKKNVLIGIISFIILSMPLILNFLSGQGLSRFRMVSIFSAKLSIFQSILRILHNYFIQLSPLYFISGEPTFITRHFVGGLTPLLNITLPFLIIGIIYTFATMKARKTSQLLIFWLFIYPLAGAITTSPPFTSRSIIGAPLFAIFIAIGIIETTKFLPYKKLVSATILLLIIINIFSFSNFYFRKYPLYSSDYWGWQYGARDIVKYFATNEQKYGQLIMAPEFNAPEIFFKFYSPNNCLTCNVGTPDTNYNPSLKQLFAVTPYYLNNHPGLEFNTLKTIYYPNESIAFKIGEVVQ